MISIVSLDGRNFCRVSLCLASGIIGVSYFASKYDRTQFDVSVQFGDKYMLKDIENAKMFDNLDIHSLMDKLFALPSQFHDRVQAVQIAFRDFINKEINVTDVLYDWARKCYYLKGNVERKLFADLVIDNSSCEEVVKYTSLNTFLATIVSNRMRMNSIVAMNDKTEEDFLLDYARNFKESIEEEGDNYRFADEKFITSFSAKKDNLDMWRFYGDNAKGVCLVFNNKGVGHDLIKKITYVTLENESLLQMKQILSRLKEIGINFRFRVFDNNRVFFKHIDYETEQEQRLLIRSTKPTGWYINPSNGIITPYIEYSLFGKDKKVSTFPLSLSEIILGPEMPQKSINIIQIKQLLQEKRIAGLEVKESKITNYRG